MGKPDASSWRSSNSQQLTFVVTQDCNLRCGYCYMIGKNNCHIMSIETAKKAIDYFVENKETLFNTEYLILDFIGGEPLLEIKLIEQIVDYFFVKTYTEKCDWFGRVRINLQSNGVLVDTPEVHHLLKKYRNLVSLGITIDGIKVKHDLHRVFPDGKGSYEIVEKNYLKAFSWGITDSTKVTFGSEDLKYLKDSIIHLWSFGIENIPANIVFEDVWKEGDDAIYHDQLVELADHIIDNKLWNKHNTSLFSDSIGFKAKSEDLMHPVCGTGNMYCVDSDGSIYNCVRFMGYSLNGKRSRKIGDIYNGIIADRLRPLKTVFPKYLNSPKCLECRVNQHCPYCSGNNYDVSENNTIFYRATAICDMFKAQVRANNYYWARLYNEYGIRRQVPYRQEYFLYFILSSDSVNYCTFMTTKKRELMSAESLIEGLEYAYENFYQPVFVHSDNSKEYVEGLLNDSKYGKKLAYELKRHIIRNIVRYTPEPDFKDVIMVLDYLDPTPSKSIKSPFILNIHADMISKLAGKIKELLPVTSRININIQGIDQQFDLLEYEKQLRAISDILFGYLSIGVKKEIRQITDRIFAKSMNNCFAGEKSITLGPDGEYYICPAFYYDKSVGVTLKESRKLTYLESAPGCDNCDAYQCNRCVYKNYVGTEELNTPTAIQCKMSFIERRCSADLLSELRKNPDLGYDHFTIPEVSYDDPLEELVKNNKAKYSSLL